MVLVLKDEDIATCLPMHVTVEVQRAAFKALAKGSATVPSRIIAPIPQNGLTALFKPAIIGESGQGGLGLKVINVVPGNAQKNLPTTPAVVMLFDNVTGVPLCIMNATWLTAARTAAGSGVATDLLAKPDAQRLVIFGAGLQAESHLEACASVRDIKDVIIINRSLGRADALVKKYKNGLFRERILRHGKAVATRGGVPAFTVLTLDDKDGIAAALASADIVCTTTNSTSPLFDANDLKPGAHVNAVGSYTPTMQELPENLISSSILVLDTAHAWDAGDLSIPRAAGSVTEAQVLGNLGDAILMENPRVKAQQMQDQLKHPFTLFKSVGVAVQDVAAGKAAFDAASQAGMGQSVDF